MYTLIKKVFLFNLLLRVQFDGITTEIKDSGINKSSAGTYHLYPYLRTKKKIFKLLETYFF